MSLTISKFYNVYINEDGLSFVKKDGRKFCGILETTGDAYLAIFDGLHQGIGDPCEFEESTERLIVFYDGKRYAFPPNLAIAKSEGNEFIKRNGRFGRTGTAPWDRYGMRFTEYYQGLEMEQDLDMYAGQVPDGFVYTKKK